MRRIVPFPLFSLALFVLWLLLVQSVSPGDVLLALGVALFWPWIMRRFVESPSRPRKPLVMLELFARVVGDMARANAQVMWTILTRRSRDVHSRFVRIPLDLKDPGGLFVLALIVTFTPGTAWAELSADKGDLLLHVLSTRDDEPVIAAIKGRYERPLREIFE
ncbi:MAG TPA: Na+/H+ antiporter subunit E [Polyangia bacterium]